jgi:hypothetical protein
MHVLFRRPAQLSRLLGAINYGISPSLWTRSRQIDSATSTTMLDTLWRDCKWTLGVNNIELARHARSLMRRLIQSRREIICKNRFENAFQDFTLCCGRKRKRIILPRVDPVALIEQHIRGKGWSRPDAGDKGVLWTLLSAPPSMAWNRVGDKSDSRERLGEKARRCGSFRSFSATNGARIFVAPGEILLARSELRTR